MGYLWRKATVGKLLVLTVVQIFGLSIWVHPQQDVMRSPSRGHHDASGWSGEQKLGKKNKKQKGYSIN